MWVLSELVRAKKKKGKKLHNLKRNLHFTPATIQFSIRLTDKILNRRSIDFMNNLPENLLAFSFVTYVS